MGKRGMPNMGGMMKKMQQMQREMEKVQREAEEKTFEVSVGGGAVVVVVNGKNELLEVKLEESVVDPEDIEMLQDLILSAVNEAMRQATEAMNQSMGRFTQGLNIPGL